MHKRTLLLSANFSTILLALMLSLTVGCAKKPDDAKISADVQSKFNQDSGLSSKQLGVQSNSGVVTLSGNVDDDAQRDAAARQAASVAGVKEVINNLQVGPATAANTKGTERHGEKGRKPRAGEDKGSSGDSGNDQGQQMANNSTPPSPADAGNSAPPPPPPPQKLIIDQGTQLTIRLVDPIDSEKNKTGDSFHATLNVPLNSNGEEAIPAGTDITGHLVDVKSAGKFAGQSQVILQLDSINAGGAAYSIQTDQYKKTGSSRGKNTAEKVGGGAVLGGIIGALAGGGKGAAIGAAAGAGVGGGVQAATKSQQIKLPSETVLNFTLQAPITVTKVADQNAGRQKLSSPQ